ncbi:DUF2306 domain-containing protein [Shimia abyssi]|uniref:Putative membrane protein DUF2306 n=1 Tax=Shimia abyssi TaxID=1662395 RepID=A0A2P8FF96_9RHOB|nr:DUF2306 domain-containing protein [Shimia abyssi]PSL20392.1 putative membrane protein DUF2306 [Shimia abyssi]
MAAIAWRIWIWVFWVLSVSVALVSLRFMPLGVAESMTFMLHHALEREVAFYAHVTLAPLALLLSPFQFSARLRSARPGLHRWMGRFYVVSILLSGLAGLKLALNSDAGPVAAWGFGLLAVIWIGVTAYAVALAMRGEIAHHRLWMIRSAALTWAAVTLRLELPILTAMLGFETGYPLVAWTCWVPNLLIAEWLVRRRAMPAAQVA